VRIEPHMAGGRIEGQVSWRHQIGHFGSLARLASLAPDRMLAPGDPSC
jgi:hypothetical protein